MEFTPVFTHGALTLGHQPRERVVRVVLLMVLLFSGQVQADQARSEYFGDFPFWESPVQVFKGQNPITAEEARTQKHIKVDFDAQGRMTDVQMRLGDQIKEPAPFFAGLYFHSEHTRISYDGPREVHSYFNRFGTRITGWGDVWEKVYTKDERGRYVRMAFFGRNGEPVENSWGTEYYAWHHQLDGSVIEERYSADGELMPHRRGFEFRRIRLTFSPDGHLALMQNIDANGDLLASASGASQYRYFYDAHGMFLRWEVYDADGNPALGPTGTAGEQYTNGDNGFAEIAFFNREGTRSLHASGAAYWRGSYGPFGNQTELSFFGTDDKPIAGNLGFHKHRFIYDETGLHLMKREYFGLDNEPTIITDGFHRAVYVRDGRGLLTELRFEDVEGNPVMNSFQNAASIRYRYDAGGVRTATEKFDLDGSLIPEAAGG